MPKGKEEKIRIPIPYEDALKAFLETPPPRKKKPKKKAKGAKSSRAKTSRS
jgi:hypothetical protein